MERVAETIQRHPAIRMARSRRTTNEHGRERLRCGRRRALGLALVVAVATVGALRFAPGVPNAP